MPRVSVIIPAHNRERMIRDAVSSILAQTMSDLELIVVDDGSTDRTVEIIDSIRDSRLRLIRLDGNRGTPSARNSGLAAANGRYIAWLDSDDVARSGRLALQTAFLDANPSIAMIGGQAGRIRKNGTPRLPPPPRPGPHEEIVATLLFRSPMLQSTVMGRAEILKQFPYSLDFPVCQDLEMYMRLMRHQRVANLPQTVIDRRSHPGQAVRKHADLVVDRKRVIFRDALRRLGIDPTEEDLDRHVTLGRIKAFEISREFLKWSERWLAGILAANRLQRIYDTAGLNDVIRGVWQRACLAALRGPDRLAGLTRLWQRPREPASPVEPPADRCVND